MKRIGITGGIGTGKSKVLDQLGTYAGVITVKTDELAKQIGKERSRKVFQIVGFPVNFENPHDCRKLADELFTNPETKKKYEEFIHPLVHERIETMIRSAPSSTDLFIVESALLFETNTDNNYDEIIVVTADTNIRIERLTSKRNISEEEALRRMSHQNDHLPIGKKYITIKNNGDEEEIKEKVDYVYLKLMNAEPKKKALYAGSFDPPTLGHEWVIKTAQKFFDVEVAIAVNPEKKSLFKFTERKDMFEHAIPGITVTSFQEEFTVDYAKRNNISVLIRGMRNTTDFAYEQMIYNINKQMDPELETFFILPEKSLGDVSSSVVKSMLGIHSWEDRVKPFVNPYVLEKLKQKINK